MALLDAFHARKFKEEAENLRNELEITRNQLETANTQLGQTQRERDELKRVLADTGRFTVLEFQTTIAQLEARIDKGHQEMESLRQLYYQRKAVVEQQIKLLHDQVAERENQLVILDDEILLQSFGLYRRLYDLQNSQMYKARLDDVCKKQARMVKSGEAAFGKSEGSRWEGARATKDLIKLILRSFNNECDACMVKVKFNNVEAIEKRIRKAYEDLNNLVRVWQISISAVYLNLKLEELHLCYEYQVKRQEEKEEQKRIREEMREQARVMKEIEERKLKLDKEGKHFNQALEAIAGQLEKATTDGERASLEAEKGRIESAIEQLEKNKLDVEMREQNTRAGYVYVISNIGSFGENVYKIGVTRRLEPEERVDELGSASVPFNFDIHAMIFSEDAPALENALHKAFEARKLNMVNSRREFFSVSLEEVETVVKTSFSKPVEFTVLPEASQYRQSLMLKDEAAKQNAIPDGATVQPETLPDPFA